MSSKQDNAKQEGSKNSETEHLDNLKAATARGFTFKGFLQTVSAVFWAFFGVRKAKSYEEDINSLNPVHVILVGIIAAVLFVVGLLFIVNLVVANS